MDESFDYVRRVVPATETNFIVLAPYTGPGDIVANALGWWGLRGYSRAYAAPGTNPAIDVVDTATGLITTTIKILPSGNLDVAAINALGYATSISKFYDQSGTGNHMTQATLANMMGVTLNFIGSLPAAESSGSKFYSSPFGIGAAPVSISLVNRPTLLAVDRVYMEDQFGNENIEANNSDLRAFGAGSPVVTLAGAVALNAMQSIQSVWTTVSSLYLNGSGTTGGTLGGLVSPTKIGSGFGATFQGEFFEMGIWTVDFSTSISNMTTNQRNYWGF